MDKMILTSEIPTSYLDIDGQDCAVMRVVGPTVARWRLGEELAKLRAGANLEHKVVAAELGCSESMLRKMESGDRKVRRPDLKVMLGLFGVTDPDVAEWLFRLQRDGDQRGWWAPYGPLPDRFTTFLSLEGSATTIRIFEPLVVHGLCQTEDYAMAISRRDMRDGSAKPLAKIERQVAIKRERQETVLGGDAPAELEIVLDEAALRRHVGSQAIMRTQLERLLEMAAAPNVRLQVIPFEQGAHSGMFGAFTIFEFEEDLHSPVVYVEGQAGNLYMEKGEEVQRCSAEFNDLVAIALSPADSERLIAGIVRELV